LTVSGESGTRAFVGIFYPPILTIAAMKSVALKSACSAVLVASTIAVAAWLAWRQELNRLNPPPVWCIACCELKSTATAHRRYDGWFLCGDCLANPK
jgi:hypothetical protein